MKTKSLYFLIALIAVAVACNPRPQPCELSDEILQQPAQVEIERMEKELFGANSTAEILGILDANELFTTQYLQADLHDSREELAAELLLINSDTSTQELYEEVMIHFEGIADIEKELENAFKYVRYYYPEFDVPKVYTFVSGFSSDLFVSEEIIVIGLDY